MGGEGSGRRPGADAILNQMRERDTIVYNAPSEDLILPNYSGLKPEVLKSNSTPLVTTETDPIYLATSGSKVSTISVSGSNLIVYGSAPDYIVENSFVEADPIFLNLSGSTALPNNRIVFVSGGSYSSSANLVFSGGNVGIGTTSPSFPLDIRTMVSGTNLNLRATATTAQNFLQLQNSSGVALGWLGHSNTASLDAIGFSANSYDNFISTDTTANNAPAGAYVYLDHSASSVGIGTTAPDTTLQVQGVMSVSNSAGNYWAFDRNGDDGRLAIMESSTSTNERLTILQAGNVGIGTTSPSHNLEVVAGTNIGINLRNDLDTKDLVKLIPSGSGTADKLIGVIQTYDDTVISSQLYAGSLSLLEKAAAHGDTAALGQIWVKNDTPNTLWFTDDAGTDHQIAFV